MLELYYFPRSHWSRIVNLALAERGLAFERRFVDIRVNATFEPDYIRMNPRGVVPTLVDDGQVIWDGPTIARHLDTKGDAPPLCRDDPESVRWAETMDELPLMLFSYAVWVKGERGERSADILEDKIRRAHDYAERYPDLRDRYERKARFFEGFRSRVYDPEHVAEAQARWSRLLDEAGEQLEGRDYLAGEYSFADCIATSVLWRLQDLGVMDGWSKDPEHGLHGYYERLRARPSFAAVFYDDPLLD